MSRSDSDVDYVRNWAGVRLGNKFEHSGLGDLLQRSIDSGREEFRITTTTAATGLQDSLLYARLIDLFRAKRIAFEAGVEPLPSGGEYINYKWPKWTQDATASSSASAASISVSIATVTR